MPTFSVTGNWKTTLHSLAVLTASTSILKVSVVDLNYRRTNTKFIAANSVIVFSIITGVGQQSIYRNVLNSLRNRRLEIMTISAGAGTDNCRGNQMALVIADDSELRPFAIFVGSAALTLEIMPADIMIFHPGRVDRADMRAVWLNQAAGSCTIENRLKQSLKDVFFNILC